jgi:hypothetical protein
MKAQILMPQEREDLRMIARLQTMNIYAQLVRKLTEGGSAAGTARWAMEQQVQGAPGSWGLGMWLRHTQALRRHVVAAKEKLRSEESRRRRTVAPVPPNPEAVLAKVEETVDKLSLMDFVPKEAQKVVKHVLGEEKAIRSIHLLQYAAIAQMARIEKMKGLDKAMPAIMIPNGHKEVQAMREIGDSLLRHEIAMGWQRGRGGHLPVPVPESELGQPSSALARRMLDFDEADRNIIRELGVRFIDMVQERIGGRLEASRLEGDTDGEGAARVEADQRPAQPSVAEGS